MEEGVTSRRRGFLRHVKRNMRVQYWFRCLISEGFSNAPAIFPTGNTLTPFPHTSAPLFGFRWNLCSVKVVHLQYFLLFLLFRLGFSANASVLDVLDGGVGDYEQDESTQKGQSYIKQRASSLLLYQNILKYISSSTMQSTWYCEM